MLKSISAWAFEPRRTPSEVFALARENRFEGVEVTIDEPGGGSCHQITIESTQSECEAVREAASKAGVKITGVASGLGWKYRLSDINPDKRRRAEEVTRQSLQRASWLGCDALLCVPGVVDAVTPYGVAHQNASRSLDALKRDALETGVSLAIENVWNNMLLSPLEMRDFLDGLGGEGGRITSYFDVGNVLRTGFPEQWISILGARISRVHLKDWKHSVGTIDGFCRLLEGDVDFPAVMKALREEEYLGPITSEFFRCEDELGAISDAMDEILAM